MCLKYAVFVFAVAALSIGLFAQETPLQEKSLADIARESKAKQKATKVVVDEDTQGLRKHAAVLPAIPADGMDNIADIVKAITEYSKIHTPLETEQVVHDWYDDYDAVYKSLIEENIRLENPSQPVIRTQQDYTRAIAQRQVDEQRKKQNGLQMARISQAFIKLRGALQGQNLKWEWFKIRCGNGNCSF
jgi:hypothetical protein